jgi:IS1 family transposase|tara:strand:+ start:904 stop:1119 length:216 start_codon:yes stop_codon:yes gene_type:complete
MCKKVNKHSLGSGTKHMCWRLWRLCPFCATQKYPDKYPKSQIILWAKLNSRKNQNGRLNREDQHKKMDEFQ